MFATNSRQPQKRTPNPLEHREISSQRTASSEDLSTQIINNPDLSQKLLAELAPIIYGEMKKTA